MKETKKEKISEFIGYLDNFGTELFDCSHIKRIKIRDLIPDGTDVGKWKFKIIIQTKGES